MLQSVGDGQAGRLLAALLERVASVEHEIGDRFPRCPDPEDPHASHGRSTPKQILPKRGVWERHADANWFCRGYQFPDLPTADDAGDGPSRSGEDPGVTPAREGNGAGRRATVVLDDLGLLAGLPQPLKPRPSWPGRPPSSRHQPLAAGRRLTADPWPTATPWRRAARVTSYSPTAGGVRRQRRRPLCQRVGGVPRSRSSAAARAAAAGGGWKYTWALRRSRHPPRTCKLSWVVPRATCWLAQK
jgi:hypothetical protein